MQTKKDEIIVCKFGGTSLADAKQIRKVVAIVKSDPRRRLVVVSAPGKRHADDPKVTDLLYQAHGLRGRARSERFEAAADRFRGIVDELQLDPVDIEMLLGEIRRSFETGEPTDAYLASRGEFLCAQIVAAALGFSFVDAAEVIRFDREGFWDSREARQETLRLLQDRLAALPAAVIPGFYGAAGSGEILTFPRGGSDLTGAIVATAINASLYENWTDVDGVRSADPRVVPGARKIDALTYDELRELSYSGATVLHEEATLPVRRAGIPICVRSTESPGSPGTMITPERTPIGQGGITGIAARQGFEVVTVGKTMMNSEVGFIRKLCGAFERHRVSIEHIASGIDTLSVIIDQRQGRQPGDLWDPVDAIREACRPDSLTADDPIALVCVVGQSMARAPGTAGRIFTALGRAGINVRMIDQGASEISIVIGVPRDRCDDAVRAIYAEFFGG